MKLIAILKLWIFALLIVPVMGETIDTTMNLTQQPSLKLEEAKSAAEKALEAEAKDFSCTVARSKTKSSGGGWTLQFRSLTLPFRWVRIEDGGKVLSNEARPGVAALLKATPSVSIEKAIELALAATEKPRRWFPVLVEWNEEKDHWLVTLVDSRRDTVYFVVDANGNSKEQKR